MGLSTCPHCGAHRVADRCPNCRDRADGALRVSAAALLLLSGCFLKPEEQALYGAPFTGMPDSAEDADGDGFSTAQGDCNDDDETVFPGAEDPVGDGLDTNCDGEDG